MQPADRPTPHSPHAAPGDSGHHPLREAWVIIGRGGRRLMWVGIAGAALLIVLGAVFALTPSWVGSLVAAQVGRTVGGDATLDRFAWQGWGKARLEGLVVRVPGWEGAGRDAELLKGRARVSPRP